MKKFTSKFIAIFIITICFTNTVEAQWTQVGSLVAGIDTANNVSMFAGFGNNMYAASNKGLFKSIDNGSTWASISYTVAVTQSVTMMSVYEEINGTLYAGSDKRLYKSTNAGTSWTWLPLPMDTISVNDIQRSGNNLVIAYNKNFNKGGVFYSTDNGATWTAATGLSPTLPLYDLHVDADTVYVGGQGGVCKSINSGVSFGAPGSGLPNGRTVLRHNGKLFAGDVGGTGLYTSNNNNASWTQANASVFAGFCQVFSVAQTPTMIIAAVDGGTVCNGGNPIKASVDGGVNWAPFMTGLTTGFYPKLGTNAALTSFFTAKQKSVYRTGTSTGIKEHKNAEDVSAFFDADKNLVVRMVNNTNAEICIYSMSGVLIYKGDFTGNEITLSDLKNKACGLYTLIISAQNETRKCKVLKQDY